MGGEPKQATTTLAEGEHQQLHKELNEFLKQQKSEFGHDMAPRRGNPGSKIRQNFTRDELLRAAGEFYNKNAARFPKAAEDFFRQHPHLRE